MTAAGALTDVGILHCLRSRCLDNTGELPETNGEPLATNGEPLATTGELDDGVRTVGEADICAAAQGIGWPEASRGAMIVRSRADGLACSRDNTGALRDEGIGGGACVEGDACAPEGDACEPSLQAGMFKGVEPGAFTGGPCAICPA